MLNHSRTKIIATIGPASSSKSTLKQMFIEGVDVCRLNFSHQDHATHGEIIKTIREINSELGTNVAILVDLQGPKIRIGEVENGAIVIEKDSIVTFVTTPIVGTSEKLYIDYEDFAVDISSGEDILIDDGKIKLQCLTTNGKDTVTARVIYGGKITPHKGVNLPQTALTLPSMTDKDIADAEFAISQNVDWLALSFVRRVSDIIELKQLIRRKKSRINVVAKIEKPQAIANIDSIIEEADAIMIARGDLGVELKFSTVPMIQKEIVEKCIDKMRPVIIATQMMESMIDNFRPTRAEANDVANAVLDGADTLMLSGETSIGKYPILSIKNMHQIIEHTEKTKYTYNRGVSPNPQSKRFIRDSVCYSASRMAEKIGAKAIITFSEQGNTAFTISGYRPKADIFTFTPTKELLSVLSLLWGIKAFYFDNISNLSEAIELTIEKLKSQGYIAPGDYVIHVGSISDTVTAKTNILKVTKVTN